VIPTRWRGEATGSWGFAATQHLCLARARRPGGENNVSQENLSRQADDLAQPDPRKIQAAPDQFEVSNCTRKALTANFQKQLCFDRNPISSS
jgi:hypothetical protein